MHWKPSSQTIVNSNMASKAFLAASLIALILGVPSEKSVLWRIYYSSVDLVERFTFRFTSSSSFTASARCYHAGVLVMCVSDNLDSTGAYFASRGEHDWDLVLDTPEQGWQNFFMAQKSTFIDQINETFKCHASGCLIAWPLCGRIPK